jgi:general secretion pathway protein G
MSITVKNNRAGFTMIELMIVIVIIGLLGGVLAPAVNNALKKARIGTAKTALMNIKKGVISFQAELARYPSTLKDLIKRPKSGDERVTKKWSGPYYGEEGIEEMPEDPWGGKFHYKLNPQGSKRPYELLSYGPNGKGSPKEEWISVWDE